MTKKESRLAGSLSKFKVLGARRPLNGVWTVALFRMNVVAHVKALDPEYYVFGDIGGVVGHAFQVARDQQRVERLAHNFRAIIHRLHQLDEGIIAHTIDNVVHLEDSLRKFNLP